MTDIQKLALLYFFLIALGVVSYISSKILIRKIDGKIDELSCKINILNSRMHILNRKVDEIENGYRAKTEEVDL